MTSLDNPPLLTSVGWQIKAANYTANSGDRIVADVSSGAWSLSLPANPAVGEEIQILTFGAGSNALTINPNGKNLNGGSTAMVISGDRLETRFVFVGAAGWISAVGGGSASPSPSPSPAPTQTYLARDTFTGQDGIRLSARQADVGGSWVEHLGTWALGSNQAKSTSLITAAPFATASLNTGKGNHQIQCTITWEINNGDNKQQGITFRQSDASNYWAFRWVFFPPGGVLQLVLAKCVNGSLIDSQAISLSPDAQTNTLKVIANGPIIQALVDGELMLQINDAFNQTATRAGLWNYNSVNASWEDFEVLNV